MTKPLLLYLSNSTEQECFVLEYTPEIYKGREAEIAEICG